SRPRGRCRSGARATFAARCSASPPRACAGAWRRPPPTTPGPRACSTGWCGANWTRRAPPPSCWSRRPMVESWIGYELDDRDGGRIGSVEGLYLDAAGGDPAWLVAALGRRRQKMIAVPYRDCAAGAGRVWAAHGRDVLREAPAVDPTRPLLREHELAICAHYGIGENGGRAAEGAGRGHGGATAPQRRPAPQRSRR